MPIRMILRQKKVCLRSADLPLFLAPTLNFFMVLLVENYLKYHIFSSNVVFDV